MRISGRGRLGRAAKALLPALAVGLGVVGGFAPQVAQAQFFDWGGGWVNGGWGADQGYGGVRPAQIYRGLADKGFRVIAPLSRDGAVFVADVIDRRGRRERVIVSAADGRIVQRFVLGSERRRAREAGLPGQDLEQQMDQADRFDGPPPVPPAPIPNLGGYSRRDASSDDESGVEPFRPRSVPRATRPLRPYVVERTPDVVSVAPDETPSQPTRLRIRPTQPLRLPIAPNTLSDRPVGPPTVTASRPVEPVLPKRAPPPAIAPSPPPASTASGSQPSTRMRDPLAIPRAEPELKPVDQPKASASVSADVPRKVVPGTVTGAPVSSPPAAAKPPLKSGDVPAAPLD